MFRKTEIADSLFYVGVNDRVKHLFENMWPLPYGVSYNSYLIMDEKTVLVDTVDACYGEEFLQKIATVLEGRSLDYLVINHMEPDHSGSIRELLRVYPEITLIGNPKTIGMTEGFYGIKDQAQAVCDGDTLELGKRTLRFYMTPMVHWPETMMTYIIDEGILFSGDAFGCFGALNGGIRDTELNTEIFYEETIRYYSNIVGKYGSPVQKALQKLSDIDLKLICSTHGPVWKEKIADVVGLYDRLSRYEGEDGVVIVYGSMYGNTAKMAETIAMELSHQGVKNIVVHNASVSHDSYILKDIFKYKGVIIGCPTYNGRLYPAIESVVSKIESRDVKNRYFGYFGSFSWAGAAVKNLKIFSENIKWEVLGEPVENKMGLTPEKAQECETLAVTMAEALKR